MSITEKNWKNKGGTSKRDCKCGSWKQHWINNTSESWPSKCSVEGCNKSATCGIHVINSNVEGEQIAPACGSCNQLEEEFNLKGGITVVSANKSETCEKQRKKIVG